MRSPAKLGNLSNLPIEFQFGTLNDLESLGSLVEDVSAVIHCAGAVRGLSLSDFVPANIEGVSNLVNVLIKQHDRPRLLFISSLAAKIPDLSDYANSKRQGENILDSYADQVGWTIFRPSAIYGQGDQEMKPLLDLLKKGISLQFSDSDSRFSLINVDDVARAALQWLVNGTAEHEKIELDDGFRGGYSWQDITDIASAVFERPIYRVPVPRPILSTLAAMIQLIAVTTKRNPMLSAGKVRELTWHDWVCSPTSRAQLQHWQPLIQFEQGLRNLYSIN